METSTLDKIKTVLPDPNRDQLYMLASLVHVGILRTSDPSRKDRLTKRLDSLLAAAQQARLPVRGERAPVDQLTEECARIGDATHFRKATGHQGLSDSEIREAWETALEYIDAMRVVSAAKKLGARQPEQFKQQMPEDRDLRHPSTRINERVRTGLAMKAAERQAELDRWAEIRRKNGIFHA